MDGYGKIFKQIYDGTLVEHWQALVTFQQMIVLCDPRGVLDMTPLAIAKRTGIPVRVIRAGIERLESPDPRSRSKDEEGRRIVRIDGHRDWGWKLVNHHRYMHMGSALSQKEYDREYSRQRRQDHAKPIEKIRQSERVGGSRRGSGKSATHTQYAVRSTQTKEEERETRLAPLPPLAVLWNEHCPTLPAVRQVTAKWRDKERARLKARPLPDWVPVLQRLNASAFCRGETDRGWKATYDWIIANDENATKVMHGKYDNHDQQPYGLAHD